MSRKHLIIGTGSAALSALETIRELNQEDEVKLVTKEDLLPYSPTALPFLLSERIEETNLWLRDRSFFERLHCTLSLNKEVVRVLPEGKKVLYQDDTEESFDTLLIATGSRPVMRSIKGIDETDCTTFHTFYDYLAIKKSLKGICLAGKKNIVIFGGGLVAAELAIALLEAGYRVEMVVRSRILRSYVDPQIGERIKSILLDKGASVHEGCLVEEVKKNAGGAEILLSNGEILFSEISIVLALGVQPNMSLIAGSAIKIGEGIIVDKKMQTSAEGIYAAGDVAESQDFFSNKRGLNGILPSAIRQGKVAGMNMTGKEAEYSGWIPMNLFNFFGHLVFSIGLSQDHNVESLKKTNQKTGQYREIRLQQDRLVGACFLDVRVDPGIFLYLIENRVNLAPYKEALLEKPQEISRWLMLETERTLGKP